MDKPTGRFLYSIENILEFLSFPDHEKVSIYSTKADGQKVFILKFDDTSLLKKYDEFISEPDITYLNENKYLKFLNPENFSTLAEFLNEHSQ